MTRKTRRTVDDGTGTRKVEDVKEHENKGGGGRSKKSSKKKSGIPRGFGSREPIMPKPPKKTKSERPKVPKDKAILLLLVIPLFILIIMDFREPSEWIAWIMFYLFWLSIFGPIYLYLEDLRKVKKVREFNRKVILTSPLLVILIVFSGFIQLFEWFRDPGFYP